MIVRPRFWVFAAFAISLGGYSGADHARLIEEEVPVPVTVANGRGKEVAQDIVVTVFYDNAAPKPYPLVVINHGRAATASGRAAMGRAKYSAVSRWFAELGFMVAVPTRVGYGVTGGEDVEDTGTCSRKKYEPGYAASAEQTLRVISVLRERDPVAKDRAVVVGQSFGGTTSITVAAENPPGVQAAINFAGGGGGDPKGRPQNPCSADLLKRMFANYGKTARIPTLWIYTENDQWMGHKLPAEWFTAFKGAGGGGEFVLYPPLGEDGHGLFSKAPAIWQPKVLEFLHANGYPGLRPQ